MNNTSRNSNQVNNPSRSSARTRVEYSNVPNNRGDKRTPAGKPSDNRSKKPNIPGTVQKTATSPVRKPATPLKKGTEPISVRIKGTIDRPMLVIIILLLCFGSVMVFSSSFATALTKKDDSYYYIKRQLLFLAIGFLFMTVVSKIDYRWMRRFTTPAFIVMLFLLALVPVFGLAQGEAVRWIKIGPIQFQPSEPMKTVLVLMLSHYFATYQKKITDYRNFVTSSIWGDLYPFLILGTVCLLVALEKHFSGVIILFTIGIVVIFAGGARKFWLILTGALGVVIVFAAIMFTDYAKARIDIWLHPENYSALGEIWQTLQGLNAIGSGGLLGVGLGNSYQKYSYVSEPQNDFIFSILCEELGFIGAMAVIVLFVAFIWRGFKIALKAPDTFSKLVVIGIVSKVGI